jgi:hypothetical protein
VQFPYHPPEEYDLRMIIAREKANYCVDLILTKSGQPFTLVIENRGVFGFERVRGADFQQNSTVRRIDRPLKAGQTYTLLVEVRETGVKSYIDGEPVSELKTYAGVTMNPDWVLPDPFALGVGAWEGAATIKSVEVRDVTGKGQSTRKN